MIKYAGFSSLLFALILFSMSCSTQQVSIPATTNLKSLTPNIGVRVDGANIDAELLNQLTREIKAQLIIAGFDIETPAEKKLALRVNVQDFDPGNAALRWTVSFGAGRGSLIYVAEYADSVGRIVAKMDGQERFTGTEVGFTHTYGAFSTFGGEETVKRVLLKEAAKHIVELATNPQPQP